MAKQTITIDAEVPDGFRAIAFRKPLAKEWYEFDGKAHQAGCGIGYDRHLILEKIEPVRESRWLPIYPGYSMATVNDLQKGWNNKLEYAARIDFEDGVPVSATPVNVALEPAEGGGA